MLRTQRTLRFRSRLLDLSQPVVMGILNVTPDSFYGGSRTSGVDAALERATQQLTEGATILDIGGYSSRPHATDISETEELDRVLPCIEAIAQAFPQAILSVDTFRASVAEAAVRAGAHMINDISGGSLDERMFATVSRLDVPYVLMHMRGTPQTMTSLTHYDDLLTDITQYFQRKVHQLRQLGQTDIILDVGFGFAKTVAQNYQLLKNLDVFHILGLPLLVGVSRKSMVYKPLQISVDDALNGTTVLHTMALQKRASILRAHDVRAAVEAIRLVTLAAQ